MNHLEKRIFPLNKVMLITRPGPNLLEHVMAALAGGVGVVQLRDKTATDAEFLRIAQQLMPLTQSYNVPLIINDRISIACHLGLGLHVGLRDTPPQEARRLLGPKALLGLTIHDKVERIIQSNDWIDYVGCGPVFQTDTKLDSSSVIGLSALSRVCTLSSKPVVAIGGITPHNSKFVWKNGARGIAACGSIFDADDLGLAVRLLSKSVL